MTAQTLFISSFDLEECQGNGSMRREVMNKKIRLLVSVLFTAALFVIGLCSIMFLTENKQSPIKYRDFYHKDEQYDVFLCGSSHMMNTVYPMELWKDFGITSYNIANSTETVATSYWVLKNALDYKKPKIVVLEIFLAGDVKVMSGNEAFLHNFFDELPFSQNKIDALKDLLPEDQSIAEYLFPFSTYHSRWAELQEMDFQKDRNLNKGAGAMVGWFQGEEVVFTKKKEAPSKTGVEYLKKIKELCDANDIRLVLLCSPYLAKKAEQRKHNAYYEVAKELGVDFLNLIDKEVVDYETDMFDRGHCNSAGGKKVTDYLGNYLLSTFGADFFDDQTGKEAWNADYEEYAADLEKQLAAENNLYNCLIRLSHDRFACEITIKQGSDAAKDPIFKKMVQNIEGAAVSEVKKQKCDVMIDIRRSGSDEVIAHKEFDTQTVLNATTK
jgi:hypothetical protein